MTRDADRVARRIDVACDAVGVPPPPIAVFLQPLVDGGARPWSLWARMRPGMADAVARWFRQWDPADMQVQEGVAPKSVRVRFDQYPGPWGLLLRDVRVDHLVVTPEGSLSLVVQDDAGSVDGYLERLAAGLDGDSDALRVRPFYGKGVHDDAQPTHRQTEVVSLAVALGYYDVPRKLDLRTLAQRLGLSLGATSELLRRGEALIVSSYVDSLTQDLKADEEEDVGKNPAPPNHSAKDWVTNDWESAADG